MSANGLESRLAKMQGQLDSMLQKLGQQEEACNEKNGVDGFAIEDLRTNWMLCLVTLFPHYFKHGFAPHQAQLWQWVFNVELGKFIDPLLAVFPRGHGKSSSAEAASVIWGAQKRRRYVWYVCAVQDNADAHVQSIGSLLESSRVADFYPNMAEPKVGKHGNRRGWRRNRFWTQSDFVIDAIGLDTAARGVKVEERRPDAIILDDVDKKHESIDVTAKRASLITSNLIPAGTSDLTVLGVQNLIHRDSVFCQLLDGRAEFLMTKQIVGPVPAVRNLKYEKRGTKYFILSGNSTWDGMNTEACEQWLNRVGPADFESEFQHNVKQVVKGSVFPMWSELHHVITDGEFETFYKARGVKVERDERGRVILPERFRIGRAQDFGTTFQHPCATAYICVSSEAYPLAGEVFAHREIVFPDWQNPRGEIEPVFLKKVATEIHLREALGKETERIDQSLFSHEQSAAMNSYRYDLPDELQLSFSKWKPDRRQGIAQLQNYMALDMTESHPFRVYPNGHEKSGQPIMGKPRIYFLVADGQGELFLNDDGELDVLPAMDADGLARARWEIPQYIYDSTLSGSEKELPRNIHDDYIDALRALAEVFFIPADRMTQQERIESKLPDELKESNVMSRFGKSDFTELYSSRQYAINQQKIQEEKEEDELRKKLRNMFGGSRPFARRRAQGRS